MSIWAAVLWAASFVAGLAALALVVHGCRHPSGQQWTGEEEWE